MRFSFRQRPIRPVSAIPVYPLQSTSKKVPETDGTVEVDPAVRQLPVWLAIEFVNWLGEVDYLAEQDIAKTQCRCVVNNNNVRRH